jgi:hypothetical protein
VYDSVWTRFVGDQREGSPSWSINSMLMSSTERVAAEGGKPMVPTTKGPQRRSGSIRGGSTSLRALPSRHA